MIRLMIRVTGVCKESMVRFIDFPFLFRKSLEQGLLALGDKRKGLVIKFVERKSQASATFKHDNINKHRTFSSHGTHEASACLQESEENSDVEL